MMIGVELIIDLLVKYGVKDVFGYLGGVIMFIYDVLYGVLVKYYLICYE